MLLDHGETDDMESCSDNQYGSVSHPGLVRQSNEDSLGFYSTADAVLLVVADGMGGYNAGEVASKICVETLRDAFLGSDATPEAILQEGLLRADEEILRLGSADADLQGMGATVVAAIMTGMRVCYSHLGDSRLYLLHEDRLERLTRDHTVVQDLLDAGLITKQQSVGHHMSHIVTKAVGLRQLRPADIEVREKTLSPGGRLLLCSDGLTDLVSDDDIYRTIAGRRPQEACDDLLALALARGGHDNVSIQVFLKA